MSEIILKKPVSLLNRDVKFDLKEFFIQASSTVAGTAIQVATANPIGALTSIVKGLSSTSKAISLEDVPVEQRAWLLVVTSLTHAIAKILEDFNDLFENNIEKSQLNTVSEQLTNQVNEIEITLTNEFFNNPHQLSFLNDLSPILKNWLQQLGLNDSQASSFIYQFKSQFPMSLHREWGTNPAYYAPIVEKLDTPFNTANRLQRQASEYRYWLQQQVSERVFEEAFGLKQIYVPLRAYYIQTKEGSSDGILNDDVIEAESSNVLRSNSNENIVKTVCGLHEEINRWIGQNDTDDNLKVISGGPGSGKSSFAKILASELAESSDIPILFIPLHRFKINDYLPEAIKKFLDNHSILTRDNLLGESKLLLIFDGLDELSMQGSNSKEVANNFTEELKEVLNDNKNMSWKAIITGRELSIQQQHNKLKKRKTVLHLLPYFINEDDRENFNDVNNLLLEDQRDEWWQKFGELKGKDFDGLPTILATENLEPITKEPLLNYLLSLSYLRQDIIFTEDTNINQIYADLLDSVHERKYTGSRTHTGINNIEKNKFIRILEEIALVVWHESGRTASIDMIMERCREVGLANYFDKFKDDAESGVVRLLMAFYFREFDGNQGDKSFEFTHKSFGEYLIARRIMLELEIMLEEVERGRNAPGCGWTLEAAFEKWIRLCGPQSIDGYLSDFLEGEVRIKSETEFGLSKISRYQELTIELLQLAVNGHSPVKKLNLATFSEDLTYVRNAEVALLAIHSLCARQTNKIIKSVKYENTEIFGKWLNLLDYKLMPKLNHLYLPNIAVYSTFIASDFESSELNNADMLFSELFIANFKNSVLEGANLTETRAESASFENANLKNSELKAANFKGSNFMGANLQNAHIKNTNFTNANLENANFEGTNHEEAIFTGANLKGTILENLYTSKEKSEEEE
ncbi:pentapeptide repeat-containing protein [uncultured Psychrobacter sp.]|uniref:pentapeptide repeat-containing protein n=1 Tax=uncultured Psychrobacter sp. TaxID=259303 RepID=UPI002596BF2A|nr:pentapeptide repeat-containing protein [uncultured Psychrobacter sp.]